MADEAESRFVAIVDDDDSVRSALQGLMKEASLPASTFASAEEFLQSGKQRQTGCLISDIRMPGMSGLELQASLRISDHSFNEHRLTEKVERALSPSPIGWYSRTTTMCCASV